MDRPNYGNKYENQINQPSHLEEYLARKERLKQAMDQLKHEVADELGYNHVNIPYHGADMTSREIGVYAGPVGGVVVKDLIAQGEKALLENYGKN